MNGTARILPAALLALLAAGPGRAAVETVEPRMVTVAGEGEIRTAPDEVTLVLRVVREDPSPASARKLMGETAALVIAALKSANIPARNIQTTQVSLGAQYKYDRGNRTLTGYRAETSIRVKLDKVKTYDETVEKALEAGASELAGVEFSHSRFRELEKDARKKAVDNALEKAKALAQAAGARIGRVHRLSEDTASIPPLLHPLRAMGAPEEGSPASIAEGEIIIRVTVRASWELLD